MTPWSLHKLWPLRPPRHLPCWILLGFRFYSLFFLGYGRLRAASLRVVLTNHLKIYKLSACHFYMFRLWRQRFPDKALLVSGAVGGPTAKALDQLTEQVCFAESWVAWSIARKLMSIGPIARKIWHMSVRCTSWKVIWLCTPLRNGLTLGAKAGETFDRGILEESDHGWRTKNPALLVSTERLADSETVPCQDARFPPSPTTLIVKALAQVFRGGVHAGWTGRRRMNSGV